MGAVNGGGVFLASITVLAAIVAALFVLRRTTGRDRTVGLATVGTAAGAGVVNLLRYIGLLPEGPLYWTLNISLVALFWALTFEMIRANKRRGTT